MGLFFGVCFQERRSSIDTRTRKYIWRALVVDQLNSARISIPNLKAMIVVYALFWCCSSVSHVGRRSGRAAMVLHHGSPYKEEK